ncbi:hypothetical protein BX666DRAFT_2075276 [Dichotomocladium elegans]|nr:hypothetical protein BX666DRAFT_2075276 [Dichotomocladium elegans]
MDLPLPSVAHQHDHYKSSAFLERISSATPPPPYDDAINQEPWVSRFGQTMMEMRRVLHDTQDTIHDMKGAFGHLDETDHLFAESLEKSIQTHHMNESDKEEAVYCDSAGEDDGIDNEEQKWTCRHHRHRTPEDTEEDRRRRKLGRASTMFPQSSSLRAQEERYRDSQWRLTMAMQELVDTVDTYHGEDMDLAATLAEPQQQSQPRSRLPVRPRPGTAPTGAAAGSTPRRRGKRQKNIHHHHHHHHYHNPQQIINVHPSFASPTMIGHMLTHAWTSIRTSLSDARKQKQNHPCAAVETAAPIAPSSCRCM